MAEKYFTVREIAERFRKTIGTVYNWIYSGKLESRQPGGQHLISETDLEKFLNRKKRKTLSENNNSLQN